MNMINDLIKQIRERKESYFDKDIFCETSFDDDYQELYDDRREMESFHDDMWNEMYMYQDGLREVW